MLRDKFKNEVYFAKTVQFVDKNIKKGRIEVQDKTNSYVGKYYPLANGIYIYIENAYSLGVSIKELMPLCKEMLDYYAKRIDLNANYSDGGSLVYSEVLNTVSMGILLNAENELKDYSNVLNKVHFEDEIINFLFSSINETIQPCETLLWPDDTSCIKLKEITQSDKEKAEVLMKEYLEKYFYTKENLEDEYNSHKRDDNSYEGYWSFESAAITKVMGLDDSGYINSPYYPKDMLHGDPPGYTFTMPVLPPDPTPQPVTKKKKWWQF